MEIWKEIPGFPDYMASNFCRVKSLTRKVPCGNSVTTKHGRVLLQRLDQFGYSFVQVKRDDGYRKRIGAHRLIALAFIDNPDGKPFVNHINSKRADNRPENLEWCTREENAQHGYKFGFLKRSLDAANKKTSKPVEQYDLNLNKIAEYESTGQAGRATGLQQAVISGACKPTRGTHYSCGFVWKYAGEEFTGALKPRLTVIKRRGASICGYQPA
jgi:hypothetical protein